MGNLSLSSSPSTLKAFIEGVSNADLGMPAIAAMRLFELSPAYFQGIQRECLELARTGTHSQVQDKDHVTHWLRPQGSVRQFSLWNTSGHYEDTSTDHNLSCRGKKFSDAARYPVLASLIASFPHCINFRLSILSPGAALPVHKESVCFSTEDGGIGLRVRFHLPVFTNVGAELILENSLYHFEEGQVLFFNQGCVHGARNLGATDRFHLIWDMLLTEPVASLMFGDTAPPFPAVRFSLADRVVRPTGYETQSSFRRLPLQVSPSTIRRVGIVQPQ